LIASQLPYLYSWQHANVVAMELHHSLPDVPSVPHHPEEVEVCAKLDAWLTHPYVGVALTLPLFNSSLRAWQAKDLQIPDGTLQQHGN
jgi:hypothetical protein